MCEFISTPITRCAFCAKLNFTFFIFDFRDGFASRLRQQQWFPYPTHPSLPLPSLSPAPHPSAPAPALPSPGPLRDRLPHHRFRGVGVPATHHGDGRDGGLWGRCRRWRSDEAYVPWLGLRGMRRHLQWQALRDSGLQWLQWFLQT